MDTRLTHFKDRPIAYFCAEFALDSHLPIYMGGLGILAGDYIREAADERAPVVGVGLFYDLNNSIKLDIVKDEQGNPLRIEVPIQDKKVTVQVFVYMVKSIPVFLLNTNIEENSTADRLITEKLYVTDREMRLKQELILGIGGLRMLEAIKIHPLIYHLNEGHSAFLALELIRHQIQEHQVGLNEAIDLARKRIVFTNHTLVAAGHDVFSNDLIALMLAGYAQNAGIPIAEVVKLGLVQESSTFSMTMLALRMAGKVNAVSVLHAKKAAEIWTDHPMIPITNGIHIGTWDRVRDLNNHVARKQELLQLIQGQTSVQWQTNHLLIGWARRFVEYKRPLAALDNLERFVQIVQNTERPVKFVFAGNPHESDDQAKEMLQKLKDLIKNRVGDSVVYLADYNMELAEKLTAGCDVWLNTPIVGFEACGTSGMKAALNGALPCTTKDGWAAEAELYKVGWQLDSDHLSENLLDIIQYDIAPMYYQQPEVWKEHMQNARAMVLNQFSAGRMLNEYVGKLYL